MTEQRDEVYDRPLAYEDGEKVVYRASGLGSCPGALVRARLGVSGSLPSDFMAERFQEGHDWEARVLAAGLGVDFIQVTTRDHLLPYGRVVESDSGLQVETEVAWGNKVVRCHPDAVAMKGATLSPYVVEVKFLGDSMYDDIVRRGKWPVTYEWQKAIEMISTGLPMLYIVGQKVVGEDEAGERMVSLGEVWTVEVDVPPFSLKEVKMRVAEIEGFVSRGEMPACPVPFDFPCSYFMNHESRDAEVIDNEVLAEWIAVWRLAAKAVDTAAKDLEFAKGAIREQMAELGLTSGRCEGVDIAVVKEAEKGNVSWSRAYKELAKVTGQSVDEDQFRGKAAAGYVRVQEAKD